MEAAPVTPNSHLHALSSSHTYSQPNYIRTMGQTVETLGAPRPFHGPDRYRRASDMVCYSPRPFEILRRARESELFAESANACCLALRCALLRSAAWWRRRLRCA